MSLSGAIARLQYHAGSLSGIKEAPAAPPESANEFPFAVAYPARGNWFNPAGWAKGLHTIFVEIHCARGILPTAVTQALAYVESFPNAVMNDPTLNSTVDTIILSEEDGGIPYTFGRLEWGGVQTIGMRFEVTVKIQSSFS